MLVKGTGQLLKYSRNGVHSTPQQGDRRRGCPPAILTVSAPHGDERQSEPRGYLDALA